MNWVLIIGGIALLVVLIIIAYSMVADPQEVDAEETRAVSDETAQERKRVLLHEQEQARHIKEEDLAQGEDIFDE